MSNDNALEDKYLEGYPRDPWKYMDYYSHPETGEFAESLSVPWFMV